MDAVTGGVGKRWVGGVGSIRIVKSYHETIYDPDIIPHMECYCEYARFSICCQMLPFICPLYNMLPKSIHAV